jgi:hypothetical protein
VNFLKTSDGDWISDIIEIGGNFVAHFSNLLSSTAPPIDEDMLFLFEPVISADDNSYLCAIPTDEEVVQALSSLGSKVPGPDGFTALFYKKYWHVVKTEVLGCIKNFFLNHILLQEQNHTHITLIPKQSGSHTVHHFRPISLCNIVYKIITKILANKLKSMLPNIIYPMQYSFLPPKTFKTTPYWPMSCCIPSKTKEEKEGSCFLTWTWKNLLTKWSGNSFYLLCRD